MNRIARLMNDKRPWMAGFGIETAMIFLEGLDLPHFAAKRQSRVRRSMAIDLLVHA